MRKLPGSLDAWAACQRGLWHFAKATVNDYALAEKFFRQAVDLDPNLPDGYCGLAMVQIYAAAGFGTGDLADALGSIGPLARQAVSLDANNAFWPSTRLFLEGQALRSSAKSGDDRRPDRILRKRAVARKSTLTRDIEPSRTFA